MTFDEFPTVNTVTDLADGILLNRVMNAVYVKRLHQVPLSISFSSSDSVEYTMTKVNHTIGDDLQLRLQNLQLLVQRILHFYEVIVCTKCSQIT